ncbi:uncharacterized protein C17orf80 homolog isoform X2 [Betta splendens]|uniref:Uncharacterized protein C17orf80 homolog isoform X2 n=1 Tax=Betta splendens TaxID=158456 RepID=A0A9W2XF48_BETSP|nr:uncharacterized protein C17orf80 homolog isoform X2 [Betta splendens]
MGSEVCPFCGKTYKRLKTHLPHCKAAGSCRAPPAPHEAPQLNTATNKSEDVSVGASQKLPSAPVASASRPPSAKKTKQKVSEQIKAAITVPVSTKSKAPNDAGKHIKPRDAPKKNTPQTKTDAESPPKEASDALHGSRNALCVDHGAGRLSQRSPVRPGSGHQGTITLQGVKAALGRAKAVSQSSVVSISNQQRDAAPEPQPPSTTPPLLPGALTQRRLGQVRLRELPEWLVCRAPRTPRELVDTVHRGWQWYHRRYMDVRRGGAGGLGLLLAGVCVLSYVWTYPHIKRERWRKYH